MPRLTWDEVGKRFYETGVDRGVLYVRASDGTYGAGVPWNGLTAVTESPSGAEATPQYADNIKYLNLVSAEELGGTIEAFTYPDEFMVCDGTAEPVAGLRVAQQNRRSFGLSYRTKVGNDVDGGDHGYKIHIVYGALAAPSEKAYATVNDSPEAMTLSWEFSTTAVDVPGLKPAALLTVDSREFTTAPQLAALTALTDALWGPTGAGTSRLPLPAEVITLLTPSGA